MVSTIFNHQLLYSKGENQFVQINTNSWQNAMSGAKRKKIKDNLEKIFGKRPHEKTLIEEGEEEE